MNRRQFSVVLGSAALVRAVDVRAQSPRKVWRLAGVHPGRQERFLDEKISPRYWGLLFDELRGRGFVKGGNLKVERHFGDGLIQNYAKLAQTVVATAPDAILCLGSRMTGRMKAATSNIPIVAFTFDPVALGLVSSLAQPGGNSTGVTSDVGLEYYTKNLEWLRDIAPAASRIAYLIPRLNWESPGYLEPVREAAARVGVSLVPLLPDSPIGESEYRRVFAVGAEARAEGLIVGDHPEVYSHIGVIVGLAAQSRIPAIYPERSFAIAGGLVSDGVDFPHLYRSVGTQIAQILSGSKPGTMPFVQASRFELAVNLITAKAPGLTIPERLLVAANFIIE